MRLVRDLCVGSEIVTAESFRDLPWASEVTPCGMNISTHICICFSFLRGRNGFLYCLSVSMPFDGVSMFFMRIDMARRPKIFEHPHAHVHTHRSRSRPKHSLCCIIFPFLSLAHCVCLSPPTYLFGLDCFSVCVSFRSFRELSLSLSHPKVQNTHTHIHTYTHTHTHNCPGWGRGRRDTVDMTIFGSPSTMRR